MCTRSIDISKMYYLSFLIYLWVMLILYYLNIHNFHPYSLSYILGWVSSVYRSSSPSRENICIHLVQPPGCQEEVLQEAWEEDVLGGGEKVQGGAHGVYFNPCKSQKFKNLCPLIKNNLTQKLSSRLKLPTENQSLSCHV